MTTPVTLDHVLRLTEQLSPLDKVRLIEHVAPQLERDLQLLTPRRSLRGLWRGLVISTLENNKPPHVHVESAENGAKFWLSPVTLVWAVGYNSRQLRQLRELVEENVAFFLEKWYEHLNYC